MPPEMPPGATGKQVLYSNVLIDVQSDPAGNVLLVIAATGETLVFPMGAEYARELGKKLTAPRVAVANGNGAH